MATAAPFEIHASLVDYLGRGILLRGAAGAGKSDLALRLIDGGAQLVADDRVILFRKGAGVFGRAPPALAGLLEVRGIGIFRLPALAEGRVSLIVDLVGPADVVRLPEPRHETQFEIAVPLLSLAPFQPGTPAALKLAVAGTPVSGALAPP